MDKFQSKIREFDLGWFRLNYSNNSLDGLGGLDGLALNFLNYSKPF